MDEALVFANFAPRAPFSLVNLRALTHGSRSVRVGGEQIEHALHFIEIAVIHCVERHPFLRQVAEWPIGRREGVDYSLAIASVEQQNAPA